MFQNMNITISFLVRVHNMPRALGSLFQKEGLYVLFLFLFVSPMFGTRKFDLLSAFALGILDCGAVRAAVSPAAFSVHIELHCGKEYFRRDCENSAGSVSSRRYFPFLPFVTCPAAKHCNPRIPFPCPLSHSLPLPPLHCLLHLTLLHFLCCPIPLPPPLLIPFSSPAPSPLPCFITFSIGSSRSIAPHPFPILLHCPSPSLSTVPPSPPFPPLLFHLHLLLPLSLSMAPSLPSSSLSPIHLLFRLPFRFFLSLSTPLSSD